MPGGEQGGSGHAHDDYIARRMAEGAADEVSDGVALQFEVNAATCISRLVPINKTQSVF